MNFKDYEPMIKNRARAWSFMTGIEAEEFESLGGLLFAKIESEKLYDPSKSSFSTYFYRTLNGNFQQMTKVIKRRQEIQTDHSDFIIEKEASQESIFLFSELLSELSSDAWEVCKTIFETPTELVNMIISGKGHKKISRHNLENYFHGQRGWTINRFRDCVSEIRSALGISK